MYRRFFKRFFDLLISLAALPFLLLAVGILAPVIYLNDPGPVFHNALRRGKDGRPFKMYKFRSMRVGAPDWRNPDGSTFSSPDDPRVTGVGRVLRRLSVDELPQILNVLLGQMSVIGPRPTLVTCAYEEIPEENRRRYAVRPGITGYAQAYYRNAIPKNGKYEYDIYYAEHLSFAMDVRILIQTAKSVLRQKNLYSAPDHGGEEPAKNENESQRV